MHVHSYLPTYVHTHIHAYIQTDLHTCVYVAVELVESGRAPPPRHYGIGFGRWGAESIA